MKSTSRHHSSILFRGGLAAAQMLMLLGLAPLTQTTPAAAATNQVTGVVFEDFNNNGTQDTGLTLNNVGSGQVGVAVDQGVGGVTVTAYDAGGAAVGSTTSVAPSGAYTLSIPAGSYRIEFSGLPAGYVPGQHGANNGTSVQFSDGVAPVNFGILQPGNYCQNNPDVLVNCYHFGASDSGNAAAPALYSFPYNAGSNDPVNIPPYDVPAPTARTVFAQIGTTWGLAWSRTAQRVYASSYFKRHAGFGSGVDGTLNNADDPGTVYVINPSTNAVVSRFLVPNATTNAHDVNNYLNDTSNTTNAAWDAVGKTSLGGIALSPDESTLFVMNQENRTLYALNTGTGAVVGSQAVPTANVPLPVGTCAPGDVRPFAVEVYNGTGYIGMVCSAESTQITSTLRAYVYTFNLSTLAFSGAPVFQAALDYPRGVGNTDPISLPPPVPVESARWNPWSPTFRANPPNQTDGLFRTPIYPQPMLASLAFDAAGNMVLGLRDRYGDQMGNEVPSNPSFLGTFFVGVVVGDQLRACGSPSTGWTLENNARCGGLGTGPENDGQGPGGGEYYAADEYMPFHEEVGMGTVSQIPGFPDVMAVTINPININGTPDTTNDGGIRWFNNSSGGFTKAYRVYNGTRAQGNLFGKAAGLGDLAVLCDEAPLELGNRVWNDTNNNGRQDPGEAPIAGVTVDLYDATGNLLNTTTTATDGTYYFTSTNPAGTTRILPNTPYSIRVDVTQGALGGRQLTTPNSVAGGNGVPDTSNNAITDVRDSDATQTGNFAIIPYTTGSAGATNHGLDFGFATPPQLVNLGNQVWSDVNNDGILNNAEVGIAGVGVTLYQDTDGSGGLTVGDALISTTTTISGGFYTFTQLTPSTGATTNYIVAVNAANFGSGNPLFNLKPSTPVIPSSNNIADDGRNHGSLIPTIGSVASTPLALTAGNQPFTSTVPGDSNWTIDFGFWQPAALGDYVWVDINRDGLQNEPPSDGFNGLTVSLYQNGVVISTTTTASKSGSPGYYLFDNLIPGTYSVTFQVPSGYAVTLPNVGSDNTINSKADSLGRTPSVTLAPGERNLTVDMGLQSLSEVAGLGDFVWLDLNKNGLQDTGEPGVPGVTVTLRNQAGTIIDTRITNASGYYSFTDLPPATYSVCFTAPQGYTFTLPNVGSNDAIDSDANPATGCTPQVTLAAGEFNPTLDAGLISPLARLGDFVWNDLNKNGIQDAGEPGVPGVTVTLRDGSNNVISTTQTNGSGLYLFDNLQPGSYIVCFALPAGFVFSPPNQGSNDAIDSDADMVTGCASTVTLQPGDSNLTIDAGIYQEVAAPALAVSLSGVPQNSSDCFTLQAGDLITYTAIVTNIGGAPAAGVIVTNTLPANTLYVSGRSTPPPASTTATVITWNAGTLNPGQSATIQYSLRVTYTAAAPTAITNQVQAGAASASTVTSLPVSFPVGGCTAVTLASFTAELQNNGGVKIVWKTALEANTFGFYVLRSATGNRANAVKVSETMVPAIGANSSYSLVDAQGATSTRYWLLEIELSGAQNEHGPYTVAGVTAQPQPQPQTQPVVGVAGGSLVAGGGMPVSSLQSPVTQQQSAQQPAQQMQAQSQPAAQVQTTQAQVQPAQPVASPLNTAQAQTQPQAANVTTEQSQPIAQANAAQTEPAQQQPVAVAEVQGAQPMQQPAIAQPAKHVQAVGAQEAVAVARGGQPANAPALTTSAQPASAPTMPWAPIAAALSLLGIGAAGAFVAYRRKMQK
jgi:uncharacterized repeat protein (TIGR01451 family)